VRQAFGGVTGVNPNLNILFFRPLYWLLARHRIVAVTRENMYVLSASYWFRWRAKRLIRVVPRQTRLGPPSGVYTRLDVGGETIWVHARFHSEIAAADSELNSLGTEKGAGLTASSSDARTMHAAEQT
jgi:hypothetical protein